MRTVGRNGIGLGAGVAVFLGMVVPGEAVAAPPADDTPITPPLVLAANLRPPADSYEVPSKATEWSKTFETTLGTYVTQVYADPVAFRDAGGTLHPIDNALKHADDVYIDVANTAAVYQNTANSFTATVGTWVDAQIPLRFSLGDASLTMAPRGGQYVRGVAGSSTVRFASVETNVDAAIGVDNSGLVDELTLKSAAAPSQFTFDLGAPGLTLSSRQGVVVAADQAGTPVAMVLAPRATDAAGQTWENVATALNADDSVTFTLDAGWLASRDRVYPVTVSPQIRSVGYQPFDVCLKQGAPAADTVNGDCYVGYDDGVASGNLAAHGAGYGQTRAYVYPYMPGSLIAQNQTVTKATLNLFTDSRSAQADQSITVEGLQGVPPLDLSWDHQPDARGAAVSTTTVPAGTNGYVGFDVTSLVQSWANGDDTFGLRLVPADDNQPAVRFAGHLAQGANQPYLTIEHHDPTYAPVGLDTKVKRAPGAVPPVPPDGGDDPNNPVTPPDPVNPNPDDPGAGDLLPPPITSKNPYDNNPFADDVDDLIGVDTITGAFTTDSTDIALYGDADLAFTRSYNSQSKEDGALGPGWRHGYDYRLTESADAVTLSTPTGQDVRFVKQADGTYKKPATADFSLTRPAAGYRVTYRDKTQYQYDGSLHLTDITTLGGDKTTLTYSGNNLQTVSNRNGTLTLTYENNKLTQVSDNTGRSVHYTYGDKRVDYTNIDGNRFQYLYNSDKRLIQMYDFKGAFFIEQAYDNEGRVTQQTLTDQGVSSVAYDTTNKRTVVTYPDGSTTTFNYNDEQKLTVKQDAFGSETSTYANDRLATHADGRGQVTSYTYDGEGNIIATAYPDGTRETSVFNSNNQATSTTRRDGTTVSHVFDDRGNNTATTDARGAVTHNVYDSENNLISTTDSLGFTTTLTNNAAGQVLTTTDPLGRTSTNAYDPQGRKIAETDPLGHTTRYTFTPGGQLVKTTNALGEEETYAVDANGNRTQLVDYAGYTETYAYNVQRQPISLTDKEGHARSWEYSSRGQVVTAIDAKGQVSRLTYDSRSRLTSIADRNNNTTTFAYDAADKIVKVTDPLGDASQYTYDAQGRVATAVDARGGTTSYTYDNMDRVVQVTDPLGHSAKYGFDANGNMTQYTDKNNNSWNYVYDSEDQHVSTTDPLGNVTRFELDAVGQVVATVSPLLARSQKTYDLNGNVTQDVDPLGNITSYEYDALDRLTKRTNPDGTTTTNVYDKSGNVTSTTDEAGSVTTYTFDKVGNQLSVTDPLGHTTSSAYDANNLLTSTTDALGGTTTYRYDPEGNQIAKTDALGATTTQAFDAKQRLISTTDALGHVTTMTYDATDNLVTTTTADGAVTTNSYDALGKLTQVTDAEGYTTTTEYDPNGHVVAQTNGRGFRQQSVYDALGRVVTTIDALGGETHHEFDADGREIRTTDPRQATTTMEYDAADHLIKSTDPAGNVTQQAYDSMGRVVAVTDALGAVNRQSYTPTGLVATATDAQGGVTSYVYDAIGNKISQQDPLGRTARYAYDALSRLTSNTDPLGHSQTATYDAVGRITAMTDKNNNTTSYNYDANGNVTSTTDAVGTVSRYAYDLVERLTETTLHRVDPQAQVDEEQTTRYAYDKRGLVTQQVDPQGHVISQTFDGNGNLVELLDADGYRTVSTYDGLDRKAGTAWYNSGAADPDKTASYAYDAVGNMVRSDDWTGRNSFEFDVLSRMTGVVDANGRTTRYAYDAVGNQTQLTYPDGTVVNKTYDSLRRLGAVIELPTPGTRFNVDAKAGLPDATSLQPAPLLVNQLAAQKAAKPSDPALAARAQSTTYAYDAAGQLTNTTYANGLREVRTYDQAGHLLRLSDTDSAKKTAQPKLKFEYRYDAQGNVTYKHQAKNGQQKAATHTYTYDALNRLVLDEEGKTEIGYAYDTLGNLVSETTTKANGKQTARLFEYNSLNQQVSQHTRKPNGELEKKSLANTFDARGNLVKTDQVKETKNKIKAKSIAQYSYDGTNKMVQGANKKGETSAYRYNSLNALVGQTLEIKKNAYGYKGVDAELVGDQALQNGLEGAAKKKTSHVEITNTVDYTSPLLDPLTESEAGALTYKYIYGLDKIAVDSIQINDSQAKKNPNAAIVTSYTLQQDAQGSIVTLTDSSGKVLSTADYDAWGVPLKQDPLKVDGRKLDLVTEYTVYPYDPVLRVYEAHARMYDAADRRFMAEDPLSGSAQDPQTLNLYPYVANNPATRVDPTGQWWNPVKAVKSAAKSVGKAVSKATKAVGDFSKKNAWIHTALDVASMVPGLNTVASVANAGLYAAEGDYANAAMSLAGAVPGGAAVKIAGKAASKLAKGASAVKKGAEAAADVSKGAKVAKGAKAAKGGEEAASGAKAASKADVAADARAAASPPGGKPHAASKSPEASKPTSATKADPGKPSSPAKVSSEKPAVSKSEYPAGAACSFAAATLVLMADGSEKAISDVVVGDEVVASDPRTGEQAAKRVMRVFVDEDIITDLVLDDGTSLATTENHPFWSVTDQRFEPADELTSGERVLAADGTTVTVDALFTDRARSGAAYNLEVDGIHTYHVGSDNILVHNNECKTALAGVDRGDGRDALGHFTGAGGYGAAGEAQGLKDYAADTGRTVIDDRVRATLPDGSMRYYDGLSPEPGTSNVYQGVEVKTGTGSRNRHQREFDAQVDSGTPATAMLGGRPISITSTRIVKVL